MAYTPQDRLVRKEVALGILREFEPPQDHIGLSLFAPLESVESDDVIFSYTRGLTAGLAPARAEDAESELAGKDESFGSGRASIIDWAIKDHFDPSDIQRYREALVIGGFAGAENLQLTVSRATEEMQTKFSRASARRRRVLDNRLEWLIMTAMDLGIITYNDGKILFTCDYGRPALQQDFLPPSAGNLYWDNTSSDPIEDILITKQDAMDRYGVNLDRVLMSKVAYRSLRKNVKFQNGLTAAYPLYQVAGWGDKAAADFIMSQTEMTLILYDSVYRTRALGSNTTVNTRFTRSNVAIFLPSTADVDSLDDAIGFGKTLTSPHPEGNWTSGYYEWERDTGPDPWGVDFGTGIKAFPVLPHLDLTYVMKVLA
jgi:hypothetical protein